MQLHLERLPPSPFKVPTVAGCKYIVVSSGLWVFSAFETHAQVAQAVAPGETVVSAGFVEMDYDRKAWCVGYSSSLNVRSRPTEDSAILQAGLALLG